MMQGIPRGLIAAIGVLDFFNVAFYAYRQMVTGRVPIVGDLQSARDLAAEMPTLFPPPLVVAGLGAVFLLSMLASGYLLLRGTRIGGWIAIAQTPLRPLTWWSAAPLLSLPIGGVFPVVAVLEVAKLLVIGLWMWQDRRSGPGAVA